MSKRLPVHGFVLAGGESRRMGADKALLRFHGRPMIEIAVEKLRVFCAEVGIAGNRDDLGVYGAVVHEGRKEAGPAAGIEAAMMKSTQPWALFLPVDVPLVPMELLRNWAEAVVERQKAGCAASYLLVNQERQPAFCMMRRECLVLVTAALERGERRLANILMSIDEEGKAGALWVCDAAAFAPAGQAAKAMEFWFSNVNRPEELVEAEAWAPGRDRKLPEGMHYKKNSDE